MDEEDPWEPFDLGWGDDGETFLRCRARIVVPSSACSSCCCPWWPSEMKQRDLWTAQVSLVVRANTASETLLRCQRSGAQEGGKEIRFPLSVVSGLHRLRADGDSPPGLELRFALQRRRLQLIALPPSGDQGCETKASKSWARLQLLHAFLAATAEAHNEELEAMRADGPVRQLVTRVWPLEWPHEDGKRASLAHLAAVLRGVVTMAASEVPKKAKYAGQGCPVCLEPWEEMPRDRPAVALQCGHGFCERCLGPAVQQLQAACPICRQTIGPACG